MTKFNQSIQPVLRAARFLLMVLLLSITAVTVTAASGILEYRPVADASVSEAFPNMNDGSANTLSVNSGPEMVSYIRFDVGDFETIEEVKLQLHVKFDSPTGFALHTVDENDWEELEITYNNAPPVGNVIYTSGPVLAGTVVEIDITPYVASGSEISLALTGLDANLIKFGSRESETYAPRLIVEGDSEPGRCGVGVCLPTRQKR